MKSAHRSITRNLLPFHETSRERSKEKQFVSLQANIFSPKYRKKVPNSFFIPKDKEKWKNLVYSKLMEVRNLQEGEEQRGPEKQVYQVSMINIFNQSQYQYAAKVEVNKINMKSLIKDHQNEKTFKRRILSARNKSSMNSHPQKAPTSYRDQKRNIKFNNPLLKENSKLQKFKQQNVDELLVETKLINKKPDSLFSQKSKKQKRFINLSDEITRKPSLNPSFNTINGPSPKKINQKHSFKVRKQSSYISPW